MATRPAQVGTQQALSDTEPAETPSGEQSPQPASKPHYQTPDAWGFGLTRGGLFGVIGWVVGDVLGKVGSPPKWLPNRMLNPDYRPFRRGLSGGLFASAGLLMGLYSGLREARMYRSQMDELEYDNAELEGKIRLLKDELKEQIKARKGDMDGKPKLNHFDPSWEEGGKPATAASIPVSSPH